MENMRCLLTGDSSLSLEFGSEISEQINNRIRAFNIALEKSDIPGIVETVPTYRALMVHYKPEIIRCGDLIKKLETLMDELSSMEIPPASVIEIPALYGGEEGPDLGFVAEHNGKTEQDVIDIHSAPEYLIYMLGFTPGFPYLGGMSKEIATPRLKQPRVRIPGGTVGIAGEQTGVYPIDSPGGWQLIGHTPLNLYDARREQPILLEAGQYIKFRPVDREEYNRIRQQVETGRYQYKIYNKGE